MDTTVVKMEEEKQNDVEDNFYEEVDIDDMEYDEDLETFFYPCPCGDRFQITNAQILDGETIGRCPSCTLYIKVLYDLVSDDDEEGEEE
mmetsp:Transcript_21597/g.60777  ORF Transcript_21597/g.60777 Transcript_21597/m.60777 type:complete len:89 (+) Transcript_21597:39-305(+)